MLVDEHEPIHAWFELTYASYLVLQRTLLQSMPVEWQRRFVACLREFEDSYAYLNLSGEFWVRQTDGRRFICDPYSSYERGRRRVKPKPSVDSVA